MSWLIVLAIRRWLTVLSGAGFIWLLSSGLFYTLDVLFYTLDQCYSWMHEVDSISHYMEILVYI